MPLQAFLAEGAGDGESRCSLPPSLMNVSLNGSHNRLMLRPKKSEPLEQIIPTVHGLPGIDRD